MWPGCRALVVGIADGVHVPTVFLGVVESTQTDADHCRAAIQLYKHSHVNFSSTIRRILVRKARQVENKGKGK